MEFRALPERLLCPGVVNIVMLNLLIALMVGTYEKVAVPSYERVIIVRNRAELILNYESQMSREELANEQWHPRYLHALVPADDDVDEEIDDDEVKRTIMFSHGNAFAELRCEVDKNRFLLQRGDAKIDELRVHMIDMEDKIDVMHAQTNETLAAILKRLEDAQ